MYDYAGVNAFSLMQPSHTTRLVSPRFSDGDPVAEHLSRSADDATACDVSWEGQSSSDNY